MNVVRRFQNPAQVVINGRTLSGSALGAREQAGLLRSVFWWMSAGLLLTFGVSVFVLNTPALAGLLSSGVIITACIVELGLVVWLSMRVMKMSATKATGVFLAYSALNGLTLAPLAMIYTSESIASAFFITAALFGSMATYGYVTKRDLSSWGSFLMMGLFGVIIASIVSLFWASSAFMFAINVACALVFTGLTAWDVQRIKNMGAEMSYAVGGNAELTQRRLAIIGALSLYLNFINLFITMLRFVGDRE